MTPPLSTMAGLLLTPLLISIGQILFKLTSRRAGELNPAGVLATLFDPFQRGRKPAQKATRGLGLGLYITDQIVRAHGGSIEAASDTSGTRFRVTLPRG